MGRGQTLFNHSGLLESSKTRGGNGIPNGTSVKFVAVPCGHCFMLPAWMGCVGRGWWRQVVWCGVVGGSGSGVVGSDGVVVAGVM